MSKENKINKDEKDAEKVVGKRVDPMDGLETDTFSKTEQKKIVEMVMDDLDAGLKSQEGWVEVKKKELLHISNAKPSEIEGIKKRSWMSDRNLGILPGVLDIYQATLLATCYNPDSIHYVATETNDVDARDNLTKFTKWGLGKNESNFYPEIDDFIANRVGHGFSVFKISWEVKYEWVDKRIPKYSKLKNKENHIVGYDIKTEKRRFERGIIKNIDNIDDIILPSYGKNVQELDFFIERIHMSFRDLCNASDMKVITNFDEDTFKAQFRTCSGKDDLRAKKLKIMRLEEVGTDSLTNMPLDLYEWYGYYTKNGKKEKYRFLVEPITETLFAGKPLRKVNRSGAVPYVGGPLRRVPGLLRGGSMTMLIANLVNALNNNYNQTSDFQYVENVPFGFANLSEFQSKGVYDLEPGVIYNVDESPISDKVYFPNLSRSLAWSYQDKEFLMQMIERLTGSASYFLTTDTKSGTATRDAIVNEKSETKFGLWVKRIQEDIAEAINMWVSLYQENAPRGLSTRILGEDGKQLFKNLSIDDLRGRYDAVMVPDITNGSKVYEKQVKLWGLELIKNSIWFAPQMNARGNWMLTKEAMKAMGYSDAERYLPEQPKAALGASDEVKNEFQLIMQGDCPESPSDGPAVIEHYEGHMKQAEERYNELPEEYRPNFDAHLFAAMVAFSNFIKKQKMDAMANKIAINAVGKIQEMARPGSLMMQPQAQPVNQPMPQAPLVEGMPGQAVEPGASMAGDIPLEGGM